MEQNTLLRCRNISKSFAATKALQKVSLDLACGEVRGLVGENGSGKSTWSSLLAGIYQLDEGEMLFKGAPYAPGSILQAQQAGVAMVVQEQSTIGDISVAANIFLGKEGQFRKRGLLDLRAMHNAAQKALAAIGAQDIDPAAQTGALAYEQRKLVEIARSMNDGPDLLVIDETTTALATNGRELIYRIIREMKEKGGSVLFITHDLDELMQVCDTITVLRDGVVIDTLAKENATVSALRRLMVGRDITDDYYRSDYDGTLCGDVALAVDGVTAGEKLENISFQLHHGEILGIGGLNDCGMHELGRVVFGLEKTLTGSVRLMPTGQEVKSPRMALKNHVGYLSKNRDQESLMLTSSIRDNIALAAFRLLKKAGLILPKTEDAYAADGVEKMSIKCRSVRQNVSELSGGNKQKVVFAKWLSNETEIFVMDCPTRGIDVGVKADMYQLIYKLKQEGKAILLISEELAELIGMSDRILILKDGKQSGEFQRSSEITEHTLIEHMI